VAADPREAIEAAFNAADSGSQDDAGIGTTSAETPSSQTPETGARTSTVADAEVIENQEIYTEEEPQVVIGRSQAAQHRYSDEWDIGPTSVLVTAESAMRIMKDSPNVVFPFEVVGTNGETAIQLNGVYDLNSVRYPGENGHGPILVVESDATSFTFLTLEGHFRGAGETIRFVTSEQNGRLILRQEGTTSGSFLSGLYSLGASNFAWKQQADNLRAAIYGGERGDFPGRWPF
jgi:hypothetical protein